MKTVTIAFVLALVGIACWAQEMPPVPSTAPTSTAAAPAVAAAPTTATAPADVSEQALAILKALEQAGEKYASLQAGVDYTVDMSSTGESETRTGAVAFQNKSGKTPARFRVQFDTYQSDTTPKPLAETVVYAFDGQWLTVAKHKIKNMTRYQVAAEGQDAEPLRLGKGPFPLPFGQQADQVVRRFRVETRPPAGGDPKDTDYLLLVPREGQADDLNFTRLEMWVDRAKSLPVKIVSRERNKNVVTVLFKDVRTGKELPAETFSPPRPAGWEYTVEPLAPPK